LRSVGGFVLVTLALLLAGAAYTTYRIQRFSQHVFAEDQLPSPTDVEASTPVPTRQAPTVRPAVERSTMTSVTTSPTEAPMAAPTLLPYGNARLTQRLQAGQRVTILLLGLGGSGHEGAYLTDSLQVATFDPSTRTLTLLSLPRDLWVYIPQIEGRGGSWNKINEAYRVGMGPAGRNDLEVPYATHAKGGRLAAQVVTQVLGLPIDGWVSLDFAGFRQFIDALGGVDVYVERAFTDTRYPANDNVAIDAGYTTIHFDAGCQHMDGARALIFARSRHAPQDGSDFGRARRQQRLLGAVQRQVFSVNTIPKVFGLLAALEDHLHTSLSRREAQDLAGWIQAQAGDQQPINIQGGGLTGNLLVESTSPQGAYLLMPKQGRGDYRAIQRYTRALLEPKPAVTATPAEATTTAPVTSAPSATQPPEQSCAR
jgi:LCP family protein required for cell wall assembly